MMQSISLLQDLIDQAIKNLSQIKAYFSKREKGGYSHESVFLPLGNHFPPL